METLHILDKSYSYQDFTPFLLSPTKIVINKDLKKKIRESYNRLTDIISSGQTIYGVNTGFGQLSQIKLLSLDVDGVLTDGGIYYSDDGKSFRKFNAKDGLGISRLLNNGIEIARIS